MSRRVSPFLMALALLGLLTAGGALRAAAWVVGKPPKLYDMLDVLGLKPL